MDQDHYKVPETGAPQSMVPVTTTVINIHGDMVVPNHIVWSLFNTVFMNWCCLGIMAFAYSVKARDRKMVGDLTGAQSFAFTARCFNISALVVGIILGIISIVLLGMAYTATYGALLQAMQERRRYH